MLYQRRMRLPHVEDPTLNGVPLERMMLSLSSDGITIDNAEPTVSVQDMPGRDGRLDLTLTDPSGGRVHGQPRHHAQPVRDRRRRRHPRRQNPARGPGRHSGHALMAGIARRIPRPHEPFRVGGQMGRPKADRHARHREHRRRPLSHRPQPLHHAQNGRERDPHQRQPAMLARMGAHPSQRNQDRQHAGRARPQAHSRIRHRDHRTHHDRHLAGRARAARQRQPHDPPTLDSDYFPLLPGANTITPSGVTAASLAYRPLTLI